MEATIIWFRQDLRLRDNPALHHAAKRGTPLIPLYIHAPEEAGAWPPGAASCWWLHYSLNSLDRALRERGSRLVIRTGSSLDTLLELANSAGARSVFWNRIYEPVLAQRDRDVTEGLAERGIDVQTFNSALLYEPWTIETRTGAPYRVFTAFWKRCQETTPDLRILPAPRVMPEINKNVISRPLNELGLLPRVRWDEGLQEAWQAGEKRANDRLRAFCRYSLKYYAERRDLPGRDGTTRLSPHLHFGEIGPRQVYRAVEDWADSRPERGIREGTEALLRELGFREFAHHILYHFPDSSEEPLDPRFARFPWAKKRTAMLRRWQQGRTGYPLVDAGMRQLWAIGWMHNRVRMVVASFLVKHGLVPWQEGARWFWDTLVDASLANNSFNWQWVAGSGADAAPYFRVFNPVLQSEKFDPEGDYIRRWVPELARLPRRWLHKPWDAPERILKGSGIQLGKDYPRPVVSLSGGRVRALAAFARIRGRG